MGKRKHAAEEVYSAHDRVRYPQAYGLNHLPANECRERLLDALENKSACQKFGSATTPSLRPIIHNMVTTMHVDTMGKKIDLNTVWRCMGNSSYDRKRFAAISLRIQSPKTTALLFSSGKVTKMNTLGCNRNRMPLLSKVSHIVQNKFCLYGVTSFTQLWHSIPVATQCKVKLTLLVRLS